MIGQDHVVRALVNALDTGRLHHAYLFTGIRGVGKTTIARIFAKSLNCQTQGVSSEPCGECEACKDIEAGRFFDLIEVDAASRTGVDDTRELLENVAYAPAAGRYKVYLIDEVHMFTKNAFNALLKTLEEPPEHVKFILATTDPDKIPLTVLSRCLQFNLKGISQGRLAGYLQELLDAESIEAEPAALTHIAHAAQGSVRDSLSLVEQGVALGGGKLTGDSVEDMLGRVSPSRVIDLVAALGTGDAGQVLQLVESLAEYGPDYSQLLGEIMQILHRIAMIQNVPGSADALVFHEPERVTELAASLSPEDVQLYHQTALLGRRDMPFAPDARDMFDMVLLRMLAFRPAGAPAAGGSGDSNRAGGGGQQGDESGDGGVKPADNPSTPPAGPAGAAALQTGESSVEQNPPAPSGPAALRAALAASTPDGATKGGSRPAPKSRAAPAVMPASNAVDVVPESSATPTATTSSHPAPPTSEQPSEPGQSADGTTTAGVAQPDAVDALPANEPPAESATESPAESPGSTPKEAQPVSAAAPAASLAPGAEPDAKSSEAVMPAAEEAMAGQPVTPELQVSAGRAMNPDDFSANTPANTPVDFPADAPVNTSGSDTPTQPQPVPAQLVPDLSAGVGTSADSASAPVSAPAQPVDIQASDDWIEVARQIGGVGMDAQLASNMAFLRRSDDILLLQIDIQHRHLHTSNNLQGLNARLQPLLLTPVRLEILEINTEAGEVFAAETLTRVLTREAEARQQAAVVSIEQDPLVLQLCQRVDGKVDPGSVRPLEQPQEAAATSAPSDHARHPELA